MLNLARKHAVTFALTLCGILVGGLLTRFYYFASLKERTPTFLVGTPISKVVVYEDLAESPIRVVRAEGSAVDGDIWTMRVFIWNAGKLAIRPEHVLEPLVLQFDDPKVEILDSRVVQTSRPTIVDPQLVRINKNELQLDFGIMDDQDGVQIQLIVATTGTDTPKPRLLGQIEGVSSISRGELVAMPLLRWRALVDAVLAASGGFVILFCVIVVLAALGLAWEEVRGRLGKATAHKTSEGRDEAGDPSASDKDREESPVNWKAVAVFISLFFFLLVFVSYMDATQRFQASTRVVVPSSIND